MLALLALAVIDVKPMGFTDPVSKDADDPAVWVNPKDPAKSVIYGTNKSKAPDGALVAFDLQGKTLQTVDKIDRPNNCDVEYGLGGMDILVATERLAHRLRIFRIGSDGLLTDVSGKTEILQGETGEASEPMGISIYKRPRDKAIFAIVSPKTGGKKNYLAEYRLTIQNGKVDATLVRRFGAYSGKKEIESIAVDDEFGYVYYSDETFGTRKYLADPDAKNADKELALFNTKGFQADHEGIALWMGKGGKGYLVCTDQITGNSEYHVYERGGKNKPLGVFRVGADETDGIDICATPLGPKYPEGIFLAMDSGPKRFAMVSWADVRKALKLP